MTRRVLLASACLAVAVSLTPLVTGPAAAAYRGPLSPLATVELVGINAQGRSVPRLGPLLRGLRDLEINVWWAVSGHHLQTLKVIAPDGSLYQTMTRTFDADANRRRLGEHGGDLLVRTLLPVAGTWITEYSMEGHWTIEIYMDANIQPVATSTFRVVP
jgi:hypothetical protein